MDNTDFVEKLEQKIQECDSRVRGKMREAHEKYKKDYNKTAVHQDLTVGEYVWLFNPTKKKGRSPKLMIPWEAEPYKIVKFINPVVVQIKRRNSRNYRVVNIDKIKRAEGISDPERRQRNVNVRIREISAKIEELLEEQQHIPKYEYEEEESMLEKMGFIHLVPECQRKSLRRGYRESL